MKSLKVNNSCKPRLTRWSTSCRRPENKCLDLRMRWMLWNSKSSSLHSPTKRTELILETEKWNSRGNSWKCKMRGTWKWMIEWLPMEMQWGGSTWKKSSGRVKRATFWEKWRSLIGRLRSIRMMSGLLRTKTKTSKETKWNFSTKMKGFESSTETN